MDAKQGNVLLVDDDPAQRITLAAILEDEFAVASAEGLAHARSLLGQRRLDVVVTDYELGDGRGAELLAAVSERFPHVSQILMTGHSQFDAVRALQQDGRVVVLFKPVDPEALLGWVRNGVASARVQRSKSKLFEKTDQLLRWSRGESGRSPGG